MADMSALLLWLPHSCDIERWLLRVVDGLKTIECTRQRVCMCLWRRTSLLFNRWLQCTTHLITVDQCIDIVFARLFSSSISRTDDVILLLFDSSIAQQPKLSRILNQLVNCTQHYPPLNEPGGQRPRRRQRNKRRWVKTTSQGILMVSPLKD